MVSRPPVTRSSRTSRPRTVLVAPGVIGRRPRAGQWPDRPRSAASAPWMAAPIAPAQTPSSAVTISTSSRDVVVTRFRSSSRIGSRSRSRCRRDPAADHDPVRRDDRDHVRDPDAEIAARPGRGRPSPARRRPGPATNASSAVAVPHAAAIWSARANASRQPRLPQPHHRPVGIDRLVAELAGRAVVALVDPAVDRDHAADPGPERQPDHRATRRARRRAAARPGRTPERR